MRGNGSKLSWRCCICRHFNVFIGIYLSSKKFKIFESKSSIFFSKFKKVQKLIFLLSKFSDSHRQRDKISHFDDVNDEIGSLEPKNSFLIFERDTMRVSEWCWKEEVQDEKSHAHFSFFVINALAAFCDMVAFYMMKNGY